MFPQCSFFSVALRPCRDASGVSVKFCMSGQASGPIFEVAAKAAFKELDTYIQLNFLTHSEREKSVSIFTDNFTTF